VNSRQPSTSTTDTQWKPGQVVLTAGIAGIALPAHVLLHVSPIPSMVVAVAILRYQALLGVLYGVLIAMFGVLYIPVKGADPSDYFTRALANITNGIGGRELIPAPARQAAPEPSRPAPEPAPAPVPQPALSPLPPAPIAARMEEEHLYWGLVHDRLPVSVPVQARGRHHRKPPQAGPEAVTYVAPDYMADRDLVPAAT
jgi:hypothetical protein